MRTITLGLVVSLSLIQGSCDDSPKEGWIGLSHAKLKPPDVKRLKLKTAEGAKVLKVADGGPAAKAGIAKDDVIFALHGQKVTSPAEFAEITKSLAAGEEVAIAVYRLGKVLELRVKLAEKPN